MKLDLIQHNLCILRSGIYPGRIISAANRLYLCLGGVQDDLEMGTGIQIIHLFCSINIFGCWWNMDQNRRKKSFKQKPRRKEPEFLMASPYCIPVLQVFGCYKRGAEGSWADSIVMKLITKAKPADMKVCH